jgi:hypothetical protein
MNVSARINPAVLLPLYAVTLTFCLVGPNCLIAQSEGVQSETALMAKRVAQASELKSGADSYVLRAKRFHQTAQDLISESKGLENEALLLAQNLKDQSGQLSKDPLKGSANFTQGIQFGAPPPLKLTAAQYGAALNQYSGDIQKFTEHAQLYDAHLQKFNAEIGACHANDQAYAANLKKLEMHLQEFHMPNLRLPSVAIATGTIRPPHLCPAMMVSEAEGQQITDKYFNDQLRLVAAQQQLQSAEKQLRNTQTGMGLANQKLETEIKRGQGERDLAVEFGKLREEYDLLKTEKERIASANKLASPTSAKGTAVTTKVQGKIQNKAKG